MDSSGRPKADAQLSALVEAYASLIRRAVRRVSGSRATLIQDDVQQNVMLAVWQQLERGQTIERPASYIFRAAIRETVRLIRRDYAHASAALDDERLVEAAAGSDPHRHLDDKERQQALMECLDAHKPLAVDRSVLDATVVVFADDPDKWRPHSRFIESARLNQQGRYTIRGLPAGKYVAIALPYVETGEEHDPDLLQEWRSRGTRFTVPEAEAHTLDLRLAGP